MAKEMFKRVQTRKHMGSFSSLTKDRGRYVWISSQPPGESGLTGESLQVTGEALVLSFHLFSGQQLWKKWQNIKRGSNLVKQCNYLSFDLSHCFHLKG